MLISFAEHEHKVKNSESISKLSFRKNYIINLNEGVTDEYIMRRISNRDSLVMKHKLQGLRALDYEVTTYSIEAFTQLVSGIE